MAFYDRVFSSELIAAIHSASAQMGPFELTRQLLYFYMSQRGIFDDEMWECVHELSESSFSDADIDYEPEQLKTLIARMSVIDSILRGLYGPIEEFPC